METEDGFIAETALFLAPGAMEYTERVRPLGVTSPSIPRPFVDALRGYKEPRSPFLPAAKHDRPCSVTSPRAIRPAFPHGS